jgi:RNA polymerase sigma-70 factor (ECF subfamily)
VKIFSTDEELMIAVKEGDLDALSPIFEKYHVKLYNFFLRLTSDRETSRDLTQNVFGRILKYRETYNEKHPFRTWIYQLARNVHIDYYNQNRYLVSDVDDAETIASRDKDAIEEMENTERHEILKEALGRLPADQQEVIELSRFQGLKYEEISKITGSSVPAIKVKVYRAIKRLKEIYFQMA